MHTKTTIEKLLEEVGIGLDGRHDWDIQVHDERFYERVLAEGSLGLGETYMARWWDCEALDTMFTKVIRGGLENRPRKNLRLILWALGHRLFNLQSRSRSFQVGRSHYDIGNDLYELMLDSRMIYSCAYWKNANNLDEAQENKLDLIARKLLLKPGMEVLDIGCGWGGLATYLAEHYQVKVLGITVSNQQVEFARKNLKNSMVEIRLQDYRDVRERFDRIVSVGMFEHVGPRNYRTFFDCVRRNLTDEGFILLHTIGKNHSSIEGDPWYDKYIFPNGVLPSAAQITKASEGFVLEDWHNFGTDYDRTLMAWHERFDKGWEQLRHRYGEEFYRMWTYYLLLSAASFRARRNQLWQITLSPGGIQGGYPSVR